MSTSVPDLSGGRYAEREPIATSRVRPKPRRVGAKVQRDGGCAAAPLCVN